MRSERRAWVGYCGLSCPTVAGGLAWVSSVLGTTVPSGPNDVPPATFTEVSQAAGIDFVETIGDDDMTNIVESAGVGCGFLDFDGDGWVDIYFVNGHWMTGLSNPDLDEAERVRLSRATGCLYRNAGDGTFVNVTEQAGLAKAAYGMGILVADYDGDGDPDLYLTNYGPNNLYRNNGDGTFTDVAEACGVNDASFSVGAAFFDYDRDGWLDLYVGNYVDYDPNYRLFYAPDGFPGPLSYAGQQDRLFRATGDGRFTDVSQKAGIVIDPPGRAMGVGALDMDQDGFVDIFVANDAMENFLFRNMRNGSFENRALELGVAYGQNGDATAAMGVEIADYNDDGRLDVFVPDMTFCCLYRNTGKRGFDDQAAASGIAAAKGQYVGWGGVFADFNLDTYLDLYVSNGDVHHLEPHKDLLLLGDGQGRFGDASERAGPWMQQEHVGRGVAGADFDNDGDIDVLVTNLNGRPALLRNDTPRAGHHWLEVALVGRAPNRDAIGAVVKARAGGRTLTRARLSTGGYLSSHDARLHFGLGTQANVHEVEVIWPDGSKRTLSDVAADQQITIHQEVEPKEIGR